ncbi:omega-scoloptoxin(05)-Ssm1a isoform X1 [Vespula pensylvanica]|uniref:omega-scoloptoxin(05)-Ssm1a isoform X1 n=1 Tax=Vespula pensylvanica TaxID=30213 RepID=UPI001CBA4719|nr:omega-scoloptoxin(05)-Ssm1a isoform X1 [Vespula pensylvanica]
MAIKDIRKILTILVIFLIYIGTVHSIRCYQCTSTNNTHPFQCNEFLTNDIDIEPESCDAIFGAQYCVKHVGRFEALECYQCTSADEWQCSDGELIKDSLQPINCSYIYKAHYCVKTIGRYGGGVGTKRFCSTSHLGNYCNYVLQPGDKLTYRTCIYTCNSDGCNSISSLRPTVSVSIISFLLLTLFYR